jgi:translation initiation factor IF-3
LTPLAANHTPQAEFRFTNRRRKTSLPPPDNRDRDHHRREPQTRVNEQIRITPIRVIGANGEQVGIIPTAQAMEMAREAQLDLVEVAPQEKPPVCKIMDFGKFKFQQKQKQKEKTKTHQQKLKEIRLRTKTDIHDVETKVNQAKKFLEHHDKVLVYVLFKGRELQHIEEGKRILQAMKEKLQETCKIEKEPAMEGKRMSMMLAPK